jgi:hypothetical protein
VPSVTFIAVLRGACTYVAMQRIRLLLVRTGRACSMSNVLSNHVQFNQ